jgi:hypothetical protein
MLARVHGPPGVDTGAPASAEALGQSSFDGGPRPQPPPDDNPESGRYQDGDTERHPPTWPVEVTLADGQQRPDKQPIEGGERQFVDERAEIEAQAAQHPRPRQRHQSKQRGQRDQRHGHQIADRHNIS